MASELMLRRKLTLRSGESRLVLMKRPNERGEHVLMKGFLWSLYLPTYPDLLVEYNIGDRYRPDLISLGEPSDRRNGIQPLFWGEAGSVSTEKIGSLIRRFPETHFAIAKWGLRLDPYVNILRSLLNRSPRTAPFDLLSFPPDADQRFIDQTGEIRITFDDIELVRL